MVIIAICCAIFADHIDYDKSSPAEVYTEEDLTGAYNTGYDKGVEEAYATTEDWFSNLQNVTINDQSIEDVFDYRYMIKDEYIEVLIRKPDGEEWVLVSDDYQN